MEVGPRSCILATLNLPYAVLCVPWTGSEAWSDYVHCHCSLCCWILVPRPSRSTDQHIFVFYVMSGALDGYVGSRMYKTFRDRQWQL